MALRRFIQNDNNLAIAYYRFSSDSQSDASIDQQREAAHKFAADNGMKIVREYSDFAKTGTSTNRPGYQLMFSEIDIIKPANLIIWKTDRLNRDATDFLVARRKLLDAGCRIRFVAEPNIDNDQADLLVTTLMAAEAQNYSYRLAENIHRGQNDIASKALYAGYKVLGYTTEPAPEFGKHRKRYIIDPNTAPIVRRIFDEYAEGKPMVEIVNELNAQGFKTSTGGPFNINGMRNILKNEAYIGIYKYKGYTIPNGMPAIVDINTFKQAQSRLIQNKREGSRRALELNEVEAPRFWLTGKLYCGRCGASMQGMSGTSKTRKTKYYYYSCKEHRAHRCKKIPVRKSLIENTVLKMLKLMQENSETIASLAVDLAARLKRERQYNKDKLRMLQDNKREVELQLNNLLKAILAGIFSETTQTSLQELEVRKKALTDEIEMEERVQKLADDEVSIQRLFEQYDKADINDPVVRDYLLEIFVEKIYVYDDKVIITVDYGNGQRNDVTWELVDEAVEADDEMFESHRNCVVEPDTDEAVEDRVARGSTASQLAPPHSEMKHLLKNAAIY